MTTRWGGRFNLKNILSDIQKQKFNLFNHSTCSFICSHFPFKVYKINLSIALLSKIVKSSGIQYLMKLLIREIRHPRGLLLQLCPFIDRLLCLISKTRFVYLYPGAVGHVIGRVNFLFS